MVQSVRETPIHFYAYSVSVAFAAYHLYRFMIHDFIVDLKDKNECNVLENDTYAHGGSEFDPENKKWSKKCKPYYCDFRYYFDTYKNICVKDKCSELEDKKDSDNTILLTILIVIGSILGLIIIELIIYYIYSSYCKKEKESNVGHLLESESNISLRNYWRELINIKCLNFPPKKIFILFYWG